MKKVYEEDFLFFISSSCIVGGHKGCPFNLAMQIIQKKHQRIKTIR